MTFERTLLAGWADMDLNAHMRNSAFLDKCSDVRMLFFADHGFSAAEFHRRRIGPVVMKDNLEYYREVSLMESLRVTLECAGLAPDGSRFHLRSDIWRADGVLAARVASVGGWLNLSTRKLMVPPDEIRDAMMAATKTADFEVLPSSIK